MTTMPIPSNNSVQNSNPHVFFFHKIGPQNFHHFSPSVVMSPVAKMRAKFRLKPTDHLGHRPTHASDVVSKELEHSGSFGYMPGTLNNHL